MAFSAEIIAKQTSRVGAIHIATLVTLAEVAAESECFEDARKLVVQFMATDHSKD